MADPVMHPVAPTQEEWRAAMGSFPSGVVVVTSWEGDRPIGATYSSFCSASLDPPLVSICSGRNSRVFGPIAERKAFGVNILGRGQQALAFAFANGPNASGFADLPHRALEEASPQIIGAPVFIDCTLEHSYDAGDHVIFIGRGVRVDFASDVPPLLYHKGGFPDFAPL
ncbi:flavin reductase family protein [Sphingomonas colocasiae]|uniref:Flavin reductase family protein n=1 Tax=Sphingomonas colocasiae TaxID=1848973 RepID=A0ABS7PU55_9SPHN|nr:flavin reductase family protein [Sphingomonas colocasiae]MBY8824205.1 flavin reductase family protein [Sphingomonas colocasiae]